MSSAGKHANEIQRGKKKQLVETAGKHGPVSSAEKCLNPWNCILWKKWESTTSEVKSRLNLYFVDYWRKNNYFVLYIPTLWRSLCEGSLSPSQSSFWLVTQGRERCVTSPNDGCEGDNGKQIGLSAGFALIMMVGDLQSHTFVRGNRI